MSTNQPAPNISIQPKDVVGRGGPMAGSAISIVGALLALFGFVLPWASCGSIQLSGMDITSQSLSGELGNTQGVFICLVPFFALGVLGVALIIAPASLWKKIPAGAKLIGTLLVGILAVATRLAYRRGMFVAMNRKL